GRALVVSAEALARVQHLFSAEGNESLDTPKGTLPGSKTTSSFPHDQRGTPKSRGTAFRSPAIVRKARASSGSAGGFKRPASSVKADAVSNPPGGGVHPSPSFQQGARVQG
ncbi:unnamed protein product, partial [Scytosiphon promiscuus]